MKSHNVNCNEVREQFAEMMPRKRAIAPEMAEHLAGCSACKSELESLRKTWALMDEWKAPEPSPYFNTRLQARLREEKLSPRHTEALEWLRLRWQPVAAMALSVALAVGIAIYGTGGNNLPASTDTTADSVSDLQTLDKNADVYNFDLLFDDDQQAAQGQ